MSNKKKTSPGICLYQAGYAVDYWHSRALGSIELCLLTHAHTDHMVGLTSTFTRRIHCSHITAKIMKTKFPALVKAKKVIGYSLNEKHTVETKNGPISLWMFDAMHCAGAVMIVVEGEFGRHLHTGDFRWEENVSVPPLVDQALFHTPFDMAYVDDTYKDAVDIFSFKTRAETELELCDVIKEYLDRDYVVLFGVRQLGREQTLHNLALRLQTPVYMSPDRFETLKAALDSNKNDLANVFVTDPDQSRLHAVNYNTLGNAKTLVQSYRKQSNQRVVFIYATALPVLKPALRDSLTFMNRTNGDCFHWVLLADHCSHNELMAFVARIDTNQLFWTSRHDIPVRRNTLTTIQPQPTATTPTASVSLTSTKTTTNDMPLTPPSFTPSPRKRVCDDNDPVVDMPNSPAMSRRKQPIRRSRPSSSSTSSGNASDCVTRTDQSNGLPQQASTSAEVSDRCKQPIRHTRASLSAQKANSLVPYSQSASNSQQFDDSMSGSKQTELMLMQAMEDVDPSAQLLPARGFTWKHLLMVAAAIEAEVHDVDLSNGDGEITCGYIGSHRDDTMCVTSGRNREIVAWLLERTTPAVRICVHQAPECVVLSADHTKIGYGTLSGSFKLVDVEKQKLLQTMTGHKANVRVVTQSPCSESIWCTGSLDSNICQWDLRASASKPACVLNFHTKTVNSVQFSPHGVLVLSGSDDATIKVVDIRQPDSLRASITGHSGAVTDVRFHPSVYLFASASTDRTIRFWDAETYECVSQSDPFISMPQRVSFHPSGLCLATVSSRDMRLCGYEPYQLYASCPLPELDPSLTALPLALTPDVPDADDAEMLAIYAVGKQGQAFLSRLTTTQYQPFMPPPLYDPEDNEYTTTSNGIEHNLPDQGDQSHEFVKPTSLPAMSRSKMRRSFNEKVPDISPSTVSGTPASDLSPGDSAPVTPSSQSVSVVTTPSECSSESMLPGHTTLNPCQSAPIKSPCRMPSTVKSSTISSTIRRTTSATSAEPGTSGVNDVPDKPLPLSLLADKSIVFESRPRISRSPTRFNVPSPSMEEDIDEDMQTFVVHKVSEKPAPPLGGVIPGKSRLGQAKSNESSSAANTTNNKRATSNSSSFKSTLIRNKSEGGEAHNQAQPSTSPSSPLNRPTPNDNQSVGSSNTLGRVRSNNDVKRTVATVPPQRSTTSSSLSNNNTKRAEMKVSPIPRHDNDSKQASSYNHIELPGSVMPVVHVNDHATNSQMLISPADFLQTTQLSGFGHATYGGSNDFVSSSHSSGVQAVSESECAQRLLGRDSSNMCAVLKHRSRALDMIKKVWRAHGLQRALRTAIEMGEPSVMNELLQLLNPRINFWSLDLCAMVLPNLVSLLESKHDVHANTAVTSLRVITSSFGDMMKRGGNQGVPSIGVDVMREERDEKCRRCMNELSFMRDSVVDRLKCSHSLPTKRVHTMKQAQMLISSVIDS